MAAHANGLELARISARDFGVYRYKLIGLAPKPDYAGIEIARSRTDVKCDVFSGLNTHAAGISCDREHGQRKPRIECQCR